MYKERQIITVKRQLKETGQVSRNWCLQRYISRLSALIQILERQGWGFTPERANGDYIYKVRYQPE